MEENDRREEFSIRQVTDRTFPEFLHLLEALACYEHLNPPDDAARSRLKSDLLQDHPRYEAYLGSLGDVAVGVRILLHLLHLPCPAYLILEDLFVLRPARVMVQEGGSLCGTKQGSRLWADGTGWCSPGTPRYRFTKIGAARLGWYTGGRGLPVTVFVTGITPHSKSPFPSR